VSLKRPEFVILVEYGRQGAQKRTNKRLREDEALSRITEMLELGAPALAGTVLKDKSSFLCFFEEAAHGREEGRSNFPIPSLKDVEAFGSTRAPSRRIRSNRSSRRCCCR
jgi:hypothetical protein